MWAQVNGTVSRGIGHLRGWRPITGGPVRGVGAGPHAALASSHFMAEIRRSRRRDILRLLRTAADATSNRPAN